MQFTPFGIQLGPVFLSFFGLILLIALAAGGALAQLRAQQRGENMDLVLDLIAWSLIGGVVLGRIFFVLNPPPSVAQVYSRDWFLAHPLDLQIGPLAVWSGGLSTAGLMLGALLGGGIVLWRSKVDSDVWATILAPAVLLTLSIAPWANLVNQQMYGPPTLLPWGVHIQNPSSLYEANLRFHPTPAYLALYALLCLVVILWLESRAKMHNRNLFVVAALLYLPGLFAADLIRADVNHIIVGLTDTQLLAVVLFWVSLAVFVLRRQVVAAIAEQNPQHLSQPETPDPQVGTTPH